MVKLKYTRSVICAFLFPLIFHFSLIVTALNINYLLSTIYYQRLLSDLVFFNKDFSHAAFNHSSDAQRHDCS